MSFGGVPLISRVFARARSVQGSRCTLLTTERPIDNPLVQLAELEEIAVVRGHTHDLVRRTMQAINCLETDVFIRVNGDSPFFEPQLANEAVVEANAETLISNLPIRRFPYGVAVEIVGSELYRRFAKGVAAPDAEHVTSHLYRSGHPQILLFGQRADDSDLKLTVDSFEDYSRLSRISSGLAPQAPYWEVFSRCEPEILWLDGTA